MKNKLQANVANDLRTKCYKTKKLTKLRGWFPTSYAYW